MPKELMNSAWIFRQLKPDFACLFSQLEAVIDAGGYILVVVTDVDQGHRSMDKKYLEGFSKKMALLFVHTLGGLIENEELWVFDQRPGEEGPALLSKA